MGDVFYNELKEASRDIAARKGKAKTAGNKALLETCRQIIDIAFVVRREGLPVLEAFTHKIEDKSIAAMIMYAIDGTSSEILEDICWSKYFASELKGYDALIYMLWLKGVLAMQEGENPIVINERLKAMLPPDLVDEFDKIYAEAQSKAMLPYGGAVNMDTVNRLVDEVILQEPGTEGYLLMRVSDHIFNDILDDEAIAQLVENIDRGTLATAFRGFDSRTRQKFFDNMPEDAAITTAGDIEYMGPLLKKHVTEAVYEIFREAYRLIKDGSLKADPSLLEVVIGPDFEGAE
ncbi:MAG: hypothetical protein IJV16_07690 [Lachnospiraceae bacterium]|nr:hypothetical protein [Lachnospiraceae bacterium]